MKSKLSIICLIAVILPGCINLEMENVVSDTIDAGKSLYQTIRRKTNGEEERKYSHSLTSPLQTDQLTLIKKCKGQIEQIISDSGYQINQTLSESSEVSATEHSQIVKCSLLVVVSK